MLPFGRLAPSRAIADIVDHYRIRTMHGPFDNVAVRARTAHAIQFYLDDPYDVTDLGSGARSRAPAVTIVGARTGCRETIALGSTVRMVSVQLRPGAFHRLTGISAAGIVDASPDARDFFGRSIVDAIERLHAGGEVGLVLDSLVAAWPTRQAHRADRIARILSLRPAHSIERLAHEANLSRRQLERAFVTRIGIGPKRFARIARFELATAARRKTNASWTRIAHDCGYSDQAHLIRDFQEFGGTSPGAMSLSFNSGLPVVR